MSLQSLLNQTITVTPHTGYDEYGRETNGTAVTYSVRFQLISKDILSPTGEVVSIDAVCYILDNPQISNNDKVVYNGIAYRVHGIDINIDGQGNAYMTKVMLQKWE